MIERVKSVLEAVGVTVDDTKALARCVVELPSGSINMAEWLCRKFSFATNLAYDLPL